MELNFSNEEHTMYRVAKISNDNNVIKLFVHNTNKASDKYGHFFLIIGDDVLIQNDKDYCIDPVSIEEAFAEVSDEPELALSLFRDVVLEVMAQ